MKQTVGSLKKATVEREINRYIVALLGMQLLTCLGGETADEHCCMIRVCVSYAILSAHNMAKCIPGVRGSRLESDRGVGLLATSAPCYHPCWFEIGHHFFCGLDVWTGVGAIGYAVFARDHRASDWYLRLDSVTFSSTCNHVVTVCD